MRRVFHAISGMYILFSSLFADCQNSAYLPFQKLSDLQNSAILDAPLFSHNSGFYTSAFTLTLSTNSSDAEIIYTVDGSEPDVNNLSGATYHYKNQYAENPCNVTGPLLAKNYATHQYSLPIEIIDRSALPNNISMLSSTFSFDPNEYFPQSPIFKGTVVRAKAVKNGVTSSTKTETYFISPMGSERFSLPVISLSVPEHSLFDYQEGIYVAGADFDVWRNANPSLFPAIYPAGNYHRHGSDYEKAAHISYFVNGTEVLNQDVGIRIRGNLSRRYASKSLTVYARPVYGDSTLSYKFFNDLEDANFDRITLSNSGNDFRDTMFRDALAQEICKNLKVETENYQPAITLFNGEYWGLLNIRERYDNNYFDRVYGIEDVDLLENDGSTAEEGDTAHYQAMMNFIENNSLADAANFIHVKTLLDPESFIDYYVANIYLDNIDWPLNNVSYWRKRTSTYIPDAPYGHDGRWRWAFHDMDKTFACDSNDISHNQLADATSTTMHNGEYQWSTLLFRKLLENNDFKNDFVNRFADLMNTIFLPARMTETLDSMKTGIDPEIIEHINRWKSPASHGVWQNEINAELNFVQARTPHQRNHIREKFEIDAEIYATLNVSSDFHGKIKINTIKISPETAGVGQNSYPWTGVYFSNIPIKLTAIPEDGYVFSHWTGASSLTDPEIIVSTGTDFELTAHFIPGTLGNDTTIHQKFTVYPNPALSRINIEGADDNTSFDLSSIQGSLIKKGKLNNGGLSLEEINSGVYLLKLKSRALEQTVKIIKTGF